ncbi:MAG: hypothetical protein M3N08_08435 [Pseudomonadota bacterium]|nr:hypothetical protein [Pseudomonadota bacterium]
MRLLITAVLALVLMSTTVMAQQGGQQVNGASGRVFGSAVCSPKIPCPSDTGHALSSAALAASANACTLQNFGGGGDLFDDTAGLDSSGCLTLKSEAAGKAGTPPQCCVITLPDNSCTFQCRLVAR